MFAICFFRLYLNTTTQICQKSACIPALHLLKSGIERGAKIGESGRGAGKSLICSGFLEAKITKQNCSGDV